jgi:small subunit ribosomal protein S17
VSERDEEARGVETAAGDAAGGGVSPKAENDERDDASSEAKHERGRSRAKRKVREGVVASTAMDKTAVVVVQTRKPHPLYRKTMVRSHRYHAHDQNNELRVGDRVRIAETRPLSKTKRWRLVEIVERAK